MLAAKINASSSVRAPRRPAAAHGAGCACCARARRAVRVSAQAPQAGFSTADIASASPKEGLVRLIDQSKVRAGGAAARRGRFARLPCDPAHGAAKALTGDYAPLNNTARSPMHCPRPPPRDATPPP